MDSLYSYLPPHQGLLPKWLLLTSIMSVGNSIQAYSTMHYTQRVYNGSGQKGGNTSPATPLSGRMFGTWTVLAGLIRFYAAYHIDDPVIYRLTVWSYVVAGFHFGSEWLYFRSASWGKGIAGPIIISSGSLAWMLWCWGDYVA